MDDADKSKAQLLASRERQLAQSARLSTLDAIASGIAHEVVQPLSAIQNFATACRNRLDQIETDDASLIEWLNAISESVGVAQQTIARLRDFKGQSGAIPARLPIDKVIAVAVELLDSDLRDHCVTTDIRLAPGITVVGDEIRLQHVVVNIIRNALDAFRQSDVSDARIAVRAELHGDDCLVSVADNGPGLPVHDAEQIFNVFFTTKPNSLGLGLAISRTIVERHRGRIWAVPDPQRGLTICFSLPAVMPGASADD